MLGEGDGEVSYDGGVDVEQVVSSHTGPTREEGRTEGNWVIPASDLTTIEQTTHFLGTPAGITTISAPFKALAKSSFGYPVTTEGVLI